MPRPPRGTWDARRGIYVAALGESYVSPTSGRRRRRNVVLTYEDGTPVERDDRAGVHAALARLIAAGEAETAKAYSPTVAELFQCWIDWHRMRGTAETTIHGYLGHARRACKVPWKGRDLAGLPAADFGPEHLFTVRASMRSRGASDGYIHASDIAIQNCFRWASQAIEGRVPLVILARNPFPPGSVRGVSAARSNRACPSWEDALAILDALDRHADRPSGPGYTKANREAARRHALAVRVVAERGCRPLEVVRLRVDEWEDKASGFVLGKHKTSRHGIAGVIPLGPATAGRVRALIAAPDRVGPWVFAPEREERNPPTREALTAWWRSNRGAIPGAERYELYSFRNCASNRLRLAGVDGRPMQLAMRHTSKVADVVYRRDDLEEAARVFREAGM